VIAFCTDAVELHCGTNTTSSTATYTFSTCREQGIVVVYFRGEEGNIFGNNSVRGLEILYY